MTAAPSNPPPGDAATRQTWPVGPGFSAPAAAATPAGGPPGADSTPVPPGSGLRPPAPPPPPAVAPPPDVAPDDASTTVDAPADATGSGTTGQAARRHRRERLGDEPPARIALANRQPVFVTLNDISKGGCCIVRKGRLELSSGDNVMVDIWTEDIETKLSIHARVCWCSHQEASSRAGLRFIETNHRLLRQIDAYVEHFRRPVDDARPQARQPIPAAGNRPAERSAPSAPASIPGAPAGLSHRDRHARQRALASMPRPGRLTSLDLHRRMRPAHRLEVARIAEETGIHIQTLYGWLRTLRLEGEVDPGRPHDPQAWSATDKISALLQVLEMGAGERAAYCSRHGLSDAMLAQWRQAAMQASEKPLLILRAEEELQRLKVRDQRDIRRLQKELRRRERSAAINDELLQVVRKLQILWEQGESP